MVGKWIQVWCHKQVHNDIKFNLSINRSISQAKNPFILIYKYHSSDYMGIIGPLWYYDFIK